MIDQWANQTVIHPLGIAVLLICIITAILQSRHQVILTLLIFAIAIPSSQRVIIVGLDFSFIRILVLIILARSFLSGEGKNLEIQKPDYIILYWMGWGILAYGALRGDFSAVISRTGYMFEAAGAYYIGRVYIRTSDDIRRIVLLLGMVAIPIMIFFLIERTTGKNMFSIFGGVPETTLIRNGRLRVQGPFPHPILAGTFWASLLPWFAAIWFGKTASRARVTLFTGCVVIIVVNTASSTPVMAVLFSLLGLSLFRIRHMMPLIWKGILLLTIVLHMIMEAPVWHLISRIDLSGGSTGWHRYNLIQQAINHINEWWLFGTLYTGHWGWGLEDVTNQYLLEGVRGGLLGMIFFIAFIVAVFNLLGKGLKRTTSKTELWILWSSGVMLFVHAMNFLAVSYFGQVTALFFLLIGAVVSVASNTSKLIAK